MNTRIESNTAIVAPMRHYTKMVIDADLPGWTLTGVDLGMDRDMIFLARDSEEGVPYYVYVTDTFLWPGVERRPLDGPLGETTPGVQALTDAIAQALPWVKIRPDGGLVASNEVLDPADPV